MRSASILLLFGTALVSVLQVPAFADDDFQAMMKEGRAAGGRGDFASAEKIFLQAKTKATEETMWQPCDQLGYLYLEIGKYAQSEVELKQALAVKKKFYEGGHQNWRIGATEGTIGHLYMLEGKFAQAEAL